MIVFKNYFKIVKKHIGTIIMFASIAIGISIANTTYSNTNQYTSVQPTLGIIDYDNSSISKNLIKYLDNNAEIEDIEDNNKEIQDLLYTAEVDSIIIIPKDFGNKLLGEEKPIIKIKKSVQNTSKYTELLINRHIKVAKSYSNASMPEKEIIERINTDLKKEIEVKVSNAQKSDISKLAIYYSFENYAFLSILIFIIGTIMCIFNKDAINKRNIISSLKMTSFTNQLFLGHIVLGLTIWLIFVIVSIIIYKDLMFNMNGILLIINSLFFTFTATSIAYLIGSFVKNPNVLSGIQNVVVIGLSFISGCFVSIEMLDSNIVNISKLFPSYWFIQNNYNIVKLSKFNFESLKPIFQHWIVIIGFGILYFTISKLIIVKRKG